MNPSMHSPYWLSVYKSASLYINPPIRLPTFIYIHKCIYLSVCFISTSLSTPASIYTYMNRQTSKQTKKPTDKQTGADTAPGGRAPHKELGITISASSNARIAISLPLVTHTHPLLQVHYGYNIIAWENNGSPLLIHSRKRGRSRGK